MRHGQHDATGHADCQTDCQRHVHSDGQRQGRRDGQRQGQADRQWDGQGRTRVMKQADGRVHTQMKGIRSDRREFTEWGVVSVNCGRGFC